MVAAGSGSRLGANLPKALVELHGTALVRRCAAEPGFLGLLQSQCNARARLFSPQEEKRLVINLMACALGGPDSPDSLRDRPPLSFPPLKAC